MSQPISTADTVLGTTAQPQPVGLLPSAVDQAMTILEAPPAVQLADPEDRSRVDELKKQLDVQSAPSVLNFGTASEAEMARFADQVLAQVMAKDMGPVHERLTEIRMIASGLSAERLKEKKGFFGKMFFNLKREIEAFGDRFKSARTQIDGISAKLEDQIQELNLGLLMLDKLFEQNLINFKELTLHIQAGKEVMQEYRTVVLPRLQAEAQAGANAPDAMVLQQRARDMASSIDRLDRKILNLEKSKTIAFATLPTIRQVQQTGVMLVEELKSALAHAIPAWKNTMLITIEQMRQRNGLETLKAMTDFTNQQLQDMAQQLDINTTAIHEQSQRGVADAEVIAQTIQSLVGTLNKIDQLESSAREARVQSRDVLAKAEAELRQQQRVTLQ